MTTVVVVESSLVLVVSVVALDVLGVFMVGLNGVVELCLVVKSSVVDCKIVE